jgi:hypothetical protein
MAKQTSKTKSKQSARLKVGKLQTSAAKMSKAQQKKVKGGAFADGSVRFLGDGSVRTIQDGTSNT